MKITLGFSPCPNDTFIFDALVNNKIDTRGIELDVVIEDVQTLNEMALAGKIDATKISYGAYPLVIKDYIMLRAGGALGKGTGPLLISGVPMPESAIKQAQIAIPGKNTTANVLFSLNYPDATNKVFLPYNEIEDYVLNSSGTLEDVREIQLGVIIHENRFTYEKKGLIKLADLGSYWENTTGFPIPLGGIIIRRDLESAFGWLLNDLIRESLRYSRQQYPVLSDFIIENAQEMEESVMREHINLYVNDFTEDLGEEGELAVQKFLQIHSSINKIEINSTPLFIKTK